MAGNFFTRLARPRPRHISVFNGPDFKRAQPVQVRVRSSQALRPAEVERSGDSYRVRFAEPEVGVSPGQACVMYDAASGSRVLGGGFIRRF